MRPFNIAGARFIPLALAITVITTVSAKAQDLIPSEGIDRLAARRYWQMSAPLPAGDRVARAVLVDENLYLLTEKNLAFAIHAPTGVIRWTALAAEPGQSLRGPTHSAQYAFFTGPASVKVLDRATGELATEPRALRGVIVEVNHDVATLSIGRAHGIQADDILQVFHNDDDVEYPDRSLAQIRVTVVKERDSRGVVVRSSRTIKIEPGMRIAANVKLPLREVKLPFASTSPAVADAHNLYIGSANQRVYSLDILGGFRNWETFVPRTVTAASVLAGDELYFASEGGRVTACLLGATQRDETRRRWEFDTEGPIFHSPVLDTDRVYVASSDRILYALDRKTGRRVWVQRFDNPPASAPELAGGRIFIQVANEGLYSVDAATGKPVWHVKEPANFLATLGRDTYLFVHGADSSLIRLDTATGEEKARVTSSRIAFAQGSREGEAILLADDQGAVMCLRPKSAPPLQPAELSAVLRNDTRMREMARLSAEQRAVAQARSAAPAPKRPEIKFIDEDDLLGSKSTAKPAGGKGLVTVEEKSSKESEEKADAGAKEDGGENGQPKAKNGDKADEGDDASGDDDGDKADKGDDDSGDDEGDKADEGDDDSGDDDGDKGDDDSGDDDDDNDNNDD